MTDHTDLISKLLEEAAAMIVHDIDDDTAARAADALKAQAARIEALEARLAEAETTISAAEEGLTNAKT